MHKQSPVNKCLTISNGQIISTTQNRAGNAYTCCEKDSWLGNIFNDDI